MKVIGAGLGRTGTFSLKLALEGLGFGPCHHMMELFEAPERCALWEAAGRGETVNWDRALAGYRSTVDWPSAAFYAQLAEAYPDAKVVLTVRDPEEWYRSAMNTIYQPHAQRSEAEVAADPHARMVRTVIWQGTFGGRFTDSDHAISIFETHNREVRQRIPSDRLMVYEVKQGWKPLCDFLEVRVPADTPFPQANSTEEWQARRAERLAGASDQR